MVSTIYQSLATGVEVQDVWASHAEENMAAMAAAAVDSQRSRGLGAVSNSYGNISGVSGGGGGEAGILIDPPTVFAADSIDWIARHHPETAGAHQYDYPFDCVVGNLPYGQVISVGGKAGGYAITADYDSTATAALEELRPLLVALAPCAPVHAYFVAGGLLRTRTRLSLI